MTQGDKYMNLREPINQQTESLETILINTFPFTKARPTNKRTLNGRYILHYLYFQNCNDIETVSISQEDWLSCSILTDTYIHSRQNNPYTDIDLFYYIIFLEPELPSGLRPTISNFVKTNENSTTPLPPAVRELLLNIDFNKLSMWFNTLIKQQAVTNRQITDNLSCYINSIFDEDSRIAGVCNEYCTQISEQLAWIVIYALCDKECFDQYENNYRIALQSNIEPMSLNQNIITDDYDANEKLMKQKVIERHKTIKKYNQISTNVLFALSIMQILCLAVPLFSFSQNQTNNTYKTLFYIIMLSCSTILLLLRFIPFYYSKNENKLKLILDFWEINPSFKNFSIIKNIDLQGISYNIFKDTSYLHTSREDIRKLLNTCVAISFVLFFGISIYAQSFPIMVAGIAGVMIFYLYIDNIISDYKFTMQYNKIDTSKICKKKSTIFTGFSKLYSWDYDISQNKFIHNNPADLNEHSADCIRYIYLAIMDRLRNIWTVITCLILAFNILLLIAGIIEYMLPFNTYFKFPNPQYYGYFSLMLIVITGIFNITVLLKTNEHYKNLIYFQYLAGIDYVNDRKIIEEYHNFYDVGTITNLDICRGIYKYNCIQFEKGTPITNIQPIDDRMHFCHRQYFRMGITSISMWLFCLIIVSIIVWHYHHISGMLAIPVTAILNPLIVLKILPWLDERRYVSALRH